MAKPNGIQATKTSVANARLAANKAGAAAEAAYSKLYNSGKVTPTNITKVKNDIAKKYGVWPNGGTR